MGKGLGYVCFIFVPKRGQFIEEAFSRAGTSNSIITAIISRKLGRMGPFQNFIGREGDPN